MEQAMAMFQTEPLKILYEGHSAKIHEISGQLLWRGDFVDPLVTIVLVGNLEDVGVFGAVPMIVGTVMMFVAAMMNGNLQARRIDQEHCQGQQGDDGFYRSFHLLYFRWCKITEKFVTFSNIPKISRVFPLRFSSDAMNRVSAMKSEKVNRILYNKIYTSVCISRNLCNFACLNFKT